MTLPVRPKSPQRLAVAERRAKASQLRLAGFTYDAIAAQLGHKTASAACQDVQRYLAATAREMADDVRAIEVSRLDMLWAQVMKILARQHPLLFQGAPVKIDGVTLQDAGPVLAATDRLLKIMERRARLLGLDAPIRAEVLTLGAIEAEIARISEEMGRAEAEQLGRTEASEAAATPEASAGA